MILFYTNDTTGATEELVVGFARVTNALGTNNDNSTLRETKSMKP